MKRRFLLFFLLACIGGYCRAQHLSFDELVKLRSFTYPLFENYVQGIGYKPDHLEYNEQCSVYTNDDNTLSFCHYYDEGLSYHDHVAVKLETTDKDEYDKIKEDASGALHHYKTRSRHYTRQHYVEHIYVNDDVSVHLYEITYKGDDRPYYQVEVYSIYANEQEP